MWKILFLIGAVILCATSATAGNQPEYDAVGCDAANRFNDAVKVAVCERGEVTPLGFTGPVSLNEWSDWTRGPNQSDDGQEFFYSTAGMLFPDPCFSGEEYPLCEEMPLYGSALVVPWDEAIFQWAIVLQKKPESDIDLNIRGCVTTHNTFDIWDDAQQTGRYRAPWGERFFIPSANPMITVKALPGPFATPGFVAPFVMDGRTVTGLKPTPLQDALYTSKALWEEKIAMVLPSTGGMNQLGQHTYNLHQGDIILIQIRIPPNNTVDLRYGTDNVVLEYIGITGSEYLDLKDTITFPTPRDLPAFCGPCRCCF